MQDLFQDYVPETPFTDRVVYAIGHFRQSPRTLQGLLHSMGADFKPSVRLSRNVHYLLIGQDPPQDQLDYLQTLHFNGYHPRILYQAELDDILSGHYAGYQTPIEIQKHLRLTIAHYQQLHVDYSHELNPLYMHELFVSPDTITPQRQLYQMLGNRGIYANSYIDETTDVLLISNHTLRLLEQGETNDVITYIQQTYNSSRATAYRFVMTSEDELLSFLSDGGDTCACLDT